MAALETMDGDAVRRWCRLAADALTQTRAAIDALNVFPVPDADTGTNLQLTLLSAADAAEAVPAGSGPGEVWRAAACRRAARRVRQFRRDRQPAAARAG